TVSHLRSGLQRFPQIVVNVPVSSKPPIEQVAPLKAAISALETQLGTEGRAVIRYSGTENILRIMLEASDENAIQHHAAHLASLIKQHIG
ncbi:MAG TPA: hypothetical protein V6D22_07025, partial [Candidatus Obscuribacterales bacterium]